jgi:hypothetical protein
MSELLSKAFDTQSIITSLQRIATVTSWSYRQRRYVDLASVMARKSSLVGIFAAFFWHAFPFLLQSDRMYTNGQKVPVQGRSLVVLWRPTQPDANSTSN